MNVNSSTRQGGQSKDAGSSLKIPANLKPIPSNHNRLLYRKGGILEKKGQGFRHQWQCRW